MIRNNGAATLDVTRVSLLDVAYNPSDTGFDSGSVVIENNGDHRTIHRRL